MHVLKPPSPLRPLRFLESPILFLAGSIEEGRAEDWQKTVEQTLAPWRGTILNPRRDSWDASWRQSIDEPEFRQQVEWELDGMARASLIPMYFAPQTKAPISLLELGLHAESGRLIVCCPHGFWRRGNIEVMAARYGFPLFDTMEPWLAHVRQRAIVHGAE